MSDDRGRPMIAKTAEGYEIRASALSCCPRALVTEYVTGEPPEPEPRSWLREALEYSVTAEDRLLLRYFDPSHLEFDARDEIEVGKWTIVGHATLHYSEIDYDCRVVVVKHVHNDMSEEEVIRKWGHEISACIYAIGAQGALAIVENVLTQEVKLFTLSLADLPDYYDLDQWLRFEIERAVEEQDPALARCTCKRCGKQKVAEEDAEELREAVGAWTELTHKIEELEARRQSIREWLEKRGVELP
jgi:hypothetical protein